jgi:hypothetical protein
MNKKFSVFLIISAVIIFLVYTSCKKIIPSELPAPTPTTTPGGPTLTETITETDTITATNTWSNATATCTITITPTRTGTMTCFKPHIRAMSRIFQMNVPSTDLVLMGACKQQSGLKYTAAIYNGANALVAVATAIQTACGELRYNNLTVPSTDTGDVNPWHAGIMEPTITPPAVFSASAPEFTDTDEFYVLYSFPAPTPTVPCTNMAGIYAGYCDTTLMKEDTFSLSSCDRVVFRNDFCLGDYQAAFYDGAGNLQKTGFCPCSVIGSGSQLADYVFTGAEAAGTWHVDLFSADTADIPASRGSGGNITTCPANISFTVN